MARSARHFPARLAPPRLTAAVVVLLASLAGCDVASNPDPTAAKPILVPSVPLAPEDGPAAPRTTRAPWRLDACPWAAFPPGSWAHYRLVTGLEERWCVVGHGVDYVALEIQVRRSATAAWDPAILARRLPRNQWPLVSEMGPAATRSAVAARSASGEFPAMRVASERRVVIVADHVPGGLVFDGSPDPTAAAGVVPTRMLLGYGVAKPG